MTNEKTFTYQTRPVLETEAASLLQAYGRLYGEVERHLFVDLQKEDLSKNALKSSYLKKYGITARQFNAIRITLEGKISSCKEQRKLEIEELKIKISCLEKKIAKIKKKDVRHQKKRRLYSLKQKLAILEEDHKLGKVSLCFGSKRLFHKQFFLEENGYRSHEDWKKEWDFARNSEFFVLGSKDEICGNQSATLTVDEKGMCHMRLRLPNSIADAYGTKYLFIKNIHFNHGHESLLQAMQEKKALSYRFKEDVKGFTIFVSFSRRQAPITTKMELGAIGVDVNVDHLAIVETDRNGNPIHKKSIPLCTYGKSRNQAKALIGDACKEIAYLAKQVNKPIVAEKLDFKKKKVTLKENASSKSSRMLSSFSYNLILENLERKAFQEGVDFHSVSPAFTSVIGKFKFAKRYGLSIHQAAALCIARRFFMFSEAPSKCPMKVVHKNIQVTSSLPVRNREEPLWKFWKGAAKKFQTALAAHFRGSADPLYRRSA